MTCRDCLYERLCKKKHERTSNYTKPYPACVFTFKEVETLCKYFTDKKLWIKLPCKIGDTMYKVCTVNDDIKIGERWDGRIVKTNCDRCGYCGCGCHDIGLRKMNCNNAINVIVPKKVTSVQMALDIEPYIGKIWFYSEWKAKCYIESYERKVKI